MVSWAEKYVGIPYKLHQWSMEGCDCYGLICIIMKAEFGIELPRYDSAYASTSTPEDIASIYAKEVCRWRKLDKPEVGSVAYFNMAGHPKHVGLVVSDRHFIHTLKSPQDSCIADFTSNRWSRRLVGFYKYE